MFDAKDLKIGTISLTLLRPSGSKRQVDNLRQVSSVHLTLRSSPHPAGLCCVEGRSEMWPHMRSATGDAPRLGAPFCSLPPARGLRRGVSPPCPSSCACCEKRFCDSY